jgi:hypothetical protein
MRALAPVVFALALVACSSTSTPPAAGQPAGEQADAGAAHGDDGGAADSGAVLAPTGTTSVEVSLGGVVRTLGRAQFGVTRKDGSLYLEAYEGGEAACPETVTPKRTLILSGVPDGEPGARSTTADGVTVSLVDFVGDQLPGTPPSAKAPAAIVTIVALDREKSAEVELDATFAGGSARGRVYATYCAAMSE